jgi:polyketide cyclase/dehydrase/lipid transport protein
VVNLASISRSRARRIDIAKRLRKSRIAPAAPARHHRRMSIAYYSTVLDQPAAQVWSLIRDFNNYPRYVDGVDHSLIENDKPGDAVGAVRRFRYDGRWIRQRLVAHSDAERSFTYAGLEPFGFPAPPYTASVEPPAAIDYEGTLRVTPVVDGNRSFLEWWVSYDAAPRDGETWQSFLVEAISQWASSLKNHVAQM